MVNVFVSHRTVDTTKAEQLATDIKSYGHVVWLDKWAVDLAACRREAEACLPKMVY